MILLLILIEAIRDALDAVLARVKRRPWAVHDHGHSVHVEPVRDLYPHDLATLDCLCGPSVRWSDPDTGNAYQRPLVVHHSLDGREATE